MMIERGTFVERRSYPAVAFAVGVCEEPVPSSLSAVQTEEPTYEEAPEQEALYEEPPLVGWT